jgi:hypothetical protein
MKQNSKIPGPEFTDQDVADLIACYGRKMDPTKKAALLAQLEGERSGFEEARTKEAEERPRDSGRDEDFSR